MAYFGLEPLSASYLTDYFSGNNTTVAFTLSRAPVSASSVIITISGVKQAASTYGVSGTTLTFSAAPPSGTNNIEVLHLGVQPDTVVQPSYRTITEFTATAGQTSFSPASYTVGFIDVFRNGVKLGTADFTATNGTTVILNNACAAGDLVRFEGFLITSFNNAIPNTAGAVGSSLIADGTVTDSKIYQLSASKLTGSRTIPAASMPAGTVLQVVNGFTSTAVTTTTTDVWIDTGIQAVITPKFANSKIMVLVNICGMHKTDSSTWNRMGIRVMRDATTIGTTSLRNMFTNTAMQLSLPGVMYSKLDSPASTSAITYGVQFQVEAASSGTGVSVQKDSNSGESQIFLMEIAA